MNKLMTMFDLDQVRKSIRECPKDEVVILLGNWSINKPKYSEEELELEEEYFDAEEFQDEIGCRLIWSDYDDLIVDPHGCYVW
jgi:hypothetical protein